MSTAAKYEALHQAIDVFLKDAEDARKILSDKFAIVSLKARELGIDVLSSKSVFLAAISDYLCRMNAGILAPVIRFFMPRALDLLLGVILGKDWFEKLKTRVGVCSLVEGKLVEASGNGNA